MQCFQTCPENTTYISNRTAKSHLEIIDILLETKQLKDIKQALFMSFYAHESVVHIKSVAPRSYHIL